MTQPISWVQMGNAYLYSSKTIDAATAPITTNKDISPGAATAGLAYATPWPMTEGNLLRFTARGWAKVSGGTLVLGLAWGGAAGKVLAETRAIKPLVATENPWSLTATTRFTNVKATEAIALTQGEVAIPISAKSESVGSIIFPLPDVTNKGGEATAITVASSQIVTLVAKFSEAGTNEIQCSNWIVELLN